MTYSILWCMLKIFSTIVALVIIGAIATGSLQKTTSHKTPPDSLKIVTPAISVEQNTIPPTSSQVLIGKKPVGDIRKRIRLPWIHLQQPNTSDPDTPKEADPVLSEKPTIKKDTALESPEIAELRSFGNTLGTTLKTFYADTDRDKNTLAVLATTTNCESILKRCALWAKSHCVFANSWWYRAEGGGWLHQNLSWVTATSDQLLPLAEKEPSRPDSQAWNGYNRALVESLSALIHIASFSRTTTSCLLKMKRARYLSVTDGCQVSVKYFLPWSRLAETIITPK